MLVSVVSFAFVVLALRLLSFVTRFDVSGSVFGRWDAVHFFAIAERGYAFEQQGAFQPGWHVLLRLAGTLVATLRALFASTPSPGGITTEDIELAALGLNLLFRTASTVALYRLAVPLVGRGRALLAGILHALPPAPAPGLTYTEPAFALALFGGLLALRRGGWVRAALYFAAATSVRATGVFAAPVLAWAMLFAEPAKRAGPAGPAEPAERAKPGSGRGRGESEGESEGRGGDGRAFRSYVSAALRNPTRTALRGLYAATLALLAASPFVLFNGALWAASCPQRPWCSRALPLAYTAIQEKYWGIRPLAYWTPEQAPNLLLAAPVVVPTLLGVCAYFARTGGRDGGGGKPRGHRGEDYGAAEDDSSREEGEVRGTRARGPLTDALYAHSAFGALTLLVQGHTQIALRLAPTDPVLWLTLAEHPRLRRAWVWWCVPWAAVSLALWAGHYPPA